MNQRESQFCAWDYLACSQMIEYYDNLPVRKTDKRNTESPEHFKKRMLRLGLTEEDVELLTKDNV
jgi:hypothetical protein